MTRLLPRIGGFSLILLGLLAAASCGRTAVTGGPSDVAEDFYGYLEEGSVDLPSTLFIDEAAEQRIEEKVSGRFAGCGELVSWKRIGSNVAINFGDQGREETVTYVYEVDSARNRTRETVVLRRNRKSEPYRIMSYTIEDAPMMKEASPMSSSSA